MIPASRLSPCAIVEGAGVSVSSDVADRGHVPQERDARERHEVEPDGDEELVAAARVERRVGRVGVGELRRPVHQHERDDEQHGEDESADRRDAGRRRALRGVVGGGHGTHRVGPGGIGGRLQLLEDPQQVERAGERLGAAGLGGHDALQTPVGGAEELDRQVHSASPQRASHWQDGRRSDMTGPSSRPSSCLRRAGQLPAARRRAALRGEPVRGGRGGLGVAWATGAGRGTGAGGRRSGRRGTAGRRGEAHDEQHRDRGHGERGHHERGLGERRPARPTGHQRDRCGRDGARQQRGERRNRLRHARRSTRAAAVILASRKGPGNDA